MPRHPRIWLACRAIDRAQRREPPTLAGLRVEAEQAPSPVGVIGDLEVAELRIPVPGAEIRARTHRPRRSAPQPAHVLLHSGAFSHGSPQQLDELAARYARTAGCVVFALEYRLAPEHPWPTAAEDTYAVLCRLTEQAPEFGVDPTRISIGGVSAGGCIAASTALLAGHRGGPRPMFQLLEIPVLDLTMSLPSVDRFASGYLLTRRIMAEAYAYYVPEPEERRAASPLHFDDLSAMPPTTVLVAEFDPLRDEGEAFARRLRAAGVQVQLVRARGHVHASTYSAMRSAQRYRQLTADALARAFACAGDG